MRPIAFIISCLFAIQIAKAQKLPDIQYGSVRAPANVKIDGRTAEWGELTAYNKATQIYYTMANDAEHLYLVIRVSSPEVMDKIINSGITLTINDRSKKMGKLLPSITFPIFNKEPYLWLNFGAKPVATGNKANDRVSLDSFARERNAMLGKYMKSIGTLNIRGITDSTISIYNDEGVKVAYAMDGALNYNYELAVPLKKIGLANKTDKFYYQIQINGVATYFTSIQELRAGMFVVTRADGKETAYRGASPAKLYATNFWGEYTLVK